MYITADSNSDSRRDNKTAYLETMTVHSNETLCLEFYYFLYGKQCSLTLYANNENRDTELLWKSLHPTARWRRMLVKVPAGSYKLSFVGKLYDKMAERSVVALDDIVLEKCSFFG